MNVESRGYAYRGREMKRLYGEVSCANCGKKVWREMSAIKIRTQFACSKKCLHDMRVGPKNPRFIERKYKRGSPGSYVLLWQPDHPSARLGRVPEHRLIVEKSLGRFLKKDEFVHHINCKKDDNRLENLVVCSNFQHNLAHASMEELIHRLIEKKLVYFNRETMKYECT